jgi:hypothetical protein
MSEPLFYFYLALGILPLFLLKSLKIKGFQLLFIQPFVWLIFLASIFEFIAFKQKWETIYWFRFFILIDFLVVFYFYYFALNKSFKLFFYSSFFGFLVLYMYLLTIWNAGESAKTDFYLTTFETLFVFIASILWFITVFSELKETSLWHAPNYYFIAGFILYYSGTFFLFLVSGFMIKNMESDFLSYWNANILFNVVLRTLIIIGIWKARKK